MFGCQCYSKYYELSCNYFDFIEEAYEDVLYCLEKLFMTQNNIPVVDGPLTNSEEGKYNLKTRYPTIPTHTHCYTRVYNVYCLGVK